MWKCKECKSNDFSELVVSGEQKVEYDKDGELIDYCDLKLKMGNTICNNCGNQGSSIKDIAEWIEEKE